MTKTNNAPVDAFGIPVPPQPRKALLFTNPLAPAAGLSRFRGYAVSADVPVEEQCNFMFRAPHDFTGAVEPGIEAVAIHGSYPDIRQAYEAAGVEVLEERPKHG